MKKWILLFGLLVPASSHAQTYAITWYKVAGGGGTSSGGTYQVSGTAGQQDASSAMTGGTYFLTGGFWSIIDLLQIPGPPELTITQSGDSVIISWPDTGSYVLQQNSNLAATGDWITSPYTVSTSDGTNSITITPPTGDLFFRLANPP
jgi:hypothetical protein